MTLACEDANSKLDIVTVADGEHVGNSLVAILTPNIFQDIEAEVTILKLKSVEILLLKIGRHFEPKVHSRFGS